MIYKNNYQRKQAVWREKYRKKVEERQKRKALYQPVIDARESLRKAFIVIGDAMIEIAKTISSGINEIAEELNDPEVIENLRKLQ